MRTFGERVVILGQKFKNAVSVQGGNDVTTVWHMALSENTSEAGVQLLLEEEKPVVAGVLVRGATIRALARLLVQVFEQDGRLSADTVSLPHVVFLMHRWFTTSELLARELTELYSRASEVAQCSGQRCRQHQDDGCPQRMYQQRVCHAIRYWIMHFPMQYYLEPGVSSVLQEFRLGLPHCLAQLLDPSNLPSYDWMRNSSMRNCTQGINEMSSPESCTGSQVKQHSRKVSLVFNHLEPEQLAEHLTYLEHKVIKRISFHDFKRYAETNRLRETPKLEKSVALFNGLTQWIQCMVLCRTTPQHRADVMVKFINVAKKLLELQNFNSLMAVVGAVSHSVLARLSKTMACLPADCKKLLGEMTDLLSANNNFSNYRRLLYESTGFKIPILGIHLKDLVSLHVALPDTLDGELLNIRKMAQLSLIFQELENLQSSTPPFSVTMDLVNTLRLSLDLAYTEDEIYELSLAREPRNNSSPQCSPTQSVLFADWASNPCPPPDPQTIEKHVNAMVEAVFKNYDSDHDGYISHEEFEAVAGNFPFIASFCVLDADHDGMISKAEMKKYFIHANCHALKNNFKHDFHETTYFKPTYCSHCAGLLWGLIRQGYKCKDCGINAHKHCKDLVVMECRNLSKSLPSQGDNSPAANSRRRFRRKKKSSMSESESSPPSPKYSTSSAGDPEALEHAYLLDGLSGGSLPSSPKPGIPLWSSPRRKISDSLLVPAHNRNISRLRAQQSCPETGCASSHHPTPPLVHSPASIHHPPLLHQATIRGSTCQHAEQLESLTHKLLAAEEAKEKLQKENQFLLQQLDNAYRELNSLKEHMGEVRQHTFSFILGQMETLHLQKDTHV